jgi:phenylalanyl-tRNA synthetase beta chain
MPDDNGGYTTPDLDPAIRTISRTEAVALLGFDLSRDEIAGHLRRMRFGAVPGAGSDDTIEVMVPAYRADIMHDYDIFEDIAIGHGYERIVPALPETMTIGEEHPVSRMKSNLREIMVGLGFYEMMPFALTSEAVHFDRMQRPRASATHLMHPISREQTMLRTTILPNLLEILSLNQHRELPQQIFEVGDVVAGGHNKVHLAAVAIDPRANFSEIKSVVDTVMHERGVVYEITDSDDPAFIAGRRAEIVVGGKCAGVFGEVHPGVILNFGLDQPVIAFEMWRL